MTIISFVSLPLGLSILTFYKWIYYWTALIRKNSLKVYIKKERLYMIARITTASNTNAILNSIFCICLFLSSMSFLFGIFMLQTKTLIFDKESQIWMGFFQICLWIIFIVMYFSILSLGQPAFFLKNGTKVYWDLVVSIGTVFFWNFLIIMI